jgi:diaminohydroxyphosphoribosylaminopyrimidine deaminase/5-amino-6-(5-phosphoribosylamino)uracil reductase
MDAKYSTDETWMMQACRLASRGEGLTRPNPPVGAVVVRGGNRVGWGYHRKAGCPHAEVYALAMAGKKASGATLYVTLEPCCTHGRTPPCTDAILSSGIRRIVIGCADPNPRHTGKGIRLLKKAGIDVLVGVCKNVASDLIAPFGHWVQTGRPYVTLKMAMSLDGRIADAEGQSRWITQSPARAVVHQLRKRADAILVGAETVIKDNPSLTCIVRSTPAAWRIVVSRSGRIPLDCKLLTDGHADRTIIAVGADVPPARWHSLTATGARVLVVPTDTGKLGLHPLLVELGKMDIMHILCEGGGGLAASLVRDRLVNEYCFFVAGRFLGDSGAVPVLGGCSWLLHDAPRIRILATQMVGSDVLIRGVPGE